MYKASYTRSLRPHIYIYIYIYIYIGELLALDSVAGILGHTLAKSVDAIFAGNRAVSTSTSTNTGSSSSSCAPPQMPAAQVLRLLALLVQKYKY
jgi:hypothetical protein